MTNKALVLCSGGPDGAVVAAFQKIDYEVTLLHFDYGQKNSEVEGRMVALLANDMDLPLLFVKTDAFRSIGSDLLTHGNPGEVITREQQRVPARNFILMALAAGIAESKGFGYIMIGNIGGTTGGNPDNYPGFTTAIDEVLKFASTGVHIRAKAPLNSLSKEAVINLGRNLNVDFAHTWSCANPPQEGYRSRVPVQCGRCPSCVARFRAFHANGMQDPLPYLVTPSTVSA